MCNGNRVADAILGGWSTNFILTLRTGFGQTIGCTKTTGQGTGCNALYTGVDPYSGPHNVGQYYNPAAFSDPPVDTTVGHTDFSPLPRGRTQVEAPGSRR